jgi:glycerate kinase
VLDALDFDGMLRDVDLVITGEGRMDAQTAQGKAPVGVARRARSKGIPVVAIVGSRADDLGGVYGQGIGLVVPAVTAPCTLPEAFTRTETNLPLAGETAMRAFLLGR